MYLIFVIDQSEIVWQSSEGLNGQLLLYKISVKGWFQTSLNKVKYVHSFQSSKLNEDKKNHTNTKVDCYELYIFVNIIQPLVI